MPESRNSRLVTITFPLSGGAEYRFSRREDGSWTGVTGLALPLALDRIAELEARLALFEAETEEHDSQGENQQ